MDHNTCNSCNFPILDESDCIIINGLANYFWHKHCFNCSNCQKTLVGVADSQFNYFINKHADTRTNDDLGKDRNNGPTNKCLLICNECSQTCNQCGKKIHSMAIILSNNESICSGCFKCSNCNQLITNLKYARTRKGLFCINCHKLLLLKRERYKKLKELEKLEKQNHSKFSIGDTHDISILSEVSNSNRPEINKNKSNRNGVVLLPKRSIKRKPTHRHSKSLSNDLLGSNSNNFEFNLKTTTTGNYSYSNTNSRQLPDTSTSDEGNTSMASQHSRSISLDDVLNSTLLNNEFTSSDEDADNDSNVDKENYANNDNFSHYTIHEEPHNNRDRLIEHSHNATDKDHFNDPNQMKSSRGITPNNDRADNMRGSQNSNSISSYNSRDSDTIVNTAPLIHVTTPKTATPTPTLASTYSHVEGDMNSRSDSSKDTTSTGSFAHGNHGNTLNETTFPSSVETSSKNYEILQFPKTANEDLHELHGGNNARINPPASTQDPVDLELSYSGYNMQQGATSDIIESFDETTNEQFDFTDMNVSKLNEPLLAEENIGKPNKQEDNYIRDLNNNLKVSGKNFRIQNNSSGENNKSNVETNMITLDGSLVDRFIVAKPNSENNSSKNETGKKKLGRSVSLKSKNIFNHWKNKNNHNNSSTSTNQHLDNSVNNNSNITFSGSNNISDTINLSSPSRTVNKSSVSTKGNLIHLASNSLSSLHHTNSKNSTDYKSNTSINNKNRTHTRNHSIDSTLIDSDTHSGWGVQNTMPQTNIITNHSNKIKSDSYIISMHNNTMNNGSNTISHLDPGHLDPNRNSHFDNNDPQRMSFPSEFSTPRIKNASRISMFRTPPLDNTSLFKIDNATMFRTPPIDSAAMFRTPPLDDKTILKRLPNCLANTSSATVNSTTNNSDDNKNLSNSSITKIESNSTKDCRMDAEPLDSTVNELELRSTISYNDTKNLNNRNGMLNANFSNDNKNVVDSVNNTSNEIMDTDLKLRNLKLDVKRMEVNKKQLIIDIENLKNDKATLLDEISFLQEQKSKIISTFENYDDNDPIVRHNKSKFWKIFGSSSNSNNTSSHQQQSQYTSNVNSTSSNNYYHNQNSAFPFSPKSPNNLSTSPSSHYMYNTHSTPKKSTAYYQSTGASSNGVHSTPPLNSVSNGTGPVDLNVNIKTQRSIVSPVSGNNNNSNYNNNNNSNNNNNTSAFNNLSIIANNVSGHNSSFSSLSTDEASGHSGIQNLSLVQICEKENSIIPKIIDICINFVETNPYNLEMEGIYRKSGASTLIEQLERKLYDTNFDDEEILNENQYDIHIVTNVLKRFLRRLPNPVIVMEIYKPLIALVRDNNLIVEFPLTKPVMTGEKRDLFEMVRSDISRLFATMPIEHYNVLKLLVNHINLVAEYSKINLMTLHNLALIFAPNILHDFDGDQDILDIKERNYFVELILLYKII